jgi:amino-acid N-acetyltransferase
MEIRKATKNDIAGIVSLISENLDTLLPRDYAEVERLLDGFFVLIDNGNVVGCSCLEVYSPKIAEIRSVAVHPTKRGNGLGRKLVEAAINEARIKQIHEIMVVTSNLKFFENLNFSTCLNEKYALFYRG